MANHPSLEQQHRDAITAAAADYRRSRQHLHTTLISAIDAGVAATVVAATLELPKTTTRRWIQHGPPNPWNRAR